MEFLKIEEDAKDTFIRSLISPEFTLPHSNRSQSILKTMDDVDPRDIDFLVGHFADDMAGFGYAPGPA